MIDAGRFVITYDILLMKLIVNDKLHFHYQFKWGSMFQAPTLRDCVFSAP